MYMLLQVDKEENGVVEGTHIQWYGFFRCSQMKFGMVVKSGISWTWFYKDYKQKENLKKRYK